MSETATKKKEPGMATLVIVLFAICAVTALLLGLTNYVTKPFIDENARLKQEKAMSDVLPADSYTEVTDQYTGGDPTVLNVYDAGDAGYVVQVKPATSSSGNLTVMVGVDGKDMEAFKNGVVEYIASTYPDIITEIDTEKKMTDELKDRILAAVKEYKSR